MWAITLIVSNKNDYLFFFSCEKWNWRVVFSVVEKLKEQQKITSSEIVAENFTPERIFHATYFVARANKN